MLPTYCQSLQANDFIPPDVKDFSHLEMKLLTVGLGEDVYARFGHTMIRIIDSENNLDYVVNWGIFDFSDPLFVVKFFLGKNLYRMGFSGFERQIAYYRDFEPRPIWQEDFVINNTQKAELLGLIKKNALPENIFYLYQYFLNNCSTIPRDYLDQIFHQKISHATKKQIVERRYRDYVFDFLSLNPIVGWALDIVFTSFNDEPLSAWSEMFFPPKLSEHLATLGIVRNKVLILDAAEPPFPPPNPYPYFSLGLAGLYLAWYLTKKVRLLGLWLAVWGALFGFLGISSSILWAFTEHFPAYHNVNLLLFWPIDFVFLFYGLKILFKNKIALPKYFLTYLHLHLITAGIYSVLWIFHVFNQNISRVVTYLLPLEILSFGFLALYLKSVNRKTS